jgi:hypothetical protein
MGTVREDRPVTGYVVAMPAIGLPHSGHRPVDDLRSYPHDSQSFAVRRRRAIKRFR